MRASVSTFCLAILFQGVAHAGDFDTAARPLIAKYCLACHNSTAHVAGLDLSAALKQDIPSHSELWRKVATRVESEAMPPTGARPTATERNTLVVSIRGAVTPQSRPSSLDFQRLTRVEYTNSLRDLLGIPFDFRRVLPDDPEGPSGFANDRLSLQMSDTLLEKYLQAAEIAVNSGFAASGQRATVRYQAENAYQAFQRSEPRSLDGVTGFLFSASPMSKYQTLEQQTTIRAPGLYRIRVRARTQMPNVSGALWFSFDNAGEYRHDAGVLIQSEALRPYETTVFLTPGDHRLFFGFDFDLVPWLPPVPDKPQVKLPADNKELAERLKRHRGADVEWADIAALPGYRQPDQASDSLARQLVRDLNRHVFDQYYSLFEESRFQMEHGYLPLSTGGPPSIVKDLLQPGYVRLSQMTGISQAALAALWESRCDAHCRENRAIFDKQKSELKALNADRGSRVGDVFVDWVELEGPLPVANESLSLNVKTAAESQRLIENFARRAFRRPLAAGERDRLLAGYRRDLDRGVESREALRRALIGILMSPHFLFWIENDSSHPLQDYRMACRLSRFLYADGPDAELETAAQRGELSTPQGLTSELERMLASPRSLQFARLFTSQWLDLSAIGRDRIPDTELFREFSWHMAEDMRQEVALDFESLIRANGSILDLIDSRRTFLNERLARLYGIAGVNGADFRPITLDNANRGGLLGTGAVLTATSLSGRTSPVYRGKFVLEKLLGQQLPPPPANAGTLPPDAGQNSHRTLRETMAAHRSSPVCASCHKVIDPIGFGLENFDFVGRWRTRDPGGPIDASGELPDGSHFAGAAGLKQYILEHRSADFVRSLTRNLLAYSLGREIGPEDDQTVQHIVQAVQSDGCRIHTLFREIVLSQPFRRQPPHKEEAE